MRTGGIHSGGKRRWTPARSSVPCGSVKHLTEDTYAAAGESCDRNLELILSESYGEKIQPAPFGTWRKKVVIHRLLKK